MKIKSVVLKIGTRDDPAYLLVNGEEIACTTYDEDGSAGLDMLESVHKNLAKLAGVFPEVEDI